MVVFLIVILCIWRPKKVFSLNLAPFSSTFMALVSCHPLIIIFDCEILFSPFRSNSGVFPVWFSGAHHLRIIHSSFQLSFSKSYRCIIQVFSNQFVISSYLNSLKYHHLFPNSFRWFVPLLLSFLILTVVRSRILFRCYCIIPFFLSF